MPEIYYTAEVITPDGSDTGVYGDGCEAGHGTALTFGWISPDWSMTTVYEKRDDERPDIYQTGEGEPSPIIWLVRRLWERLSGFPDDNGRGTYYSGQADEPNPYNGVSVSVAAHAEGFSGAEFSEVAEILEITKREYPRFRLLPDKVSSYGEFMNRAPSAAWSIREQT